MNPSEDMAWQRKRKEEVGWATLAVLQASWGLMAHFNTNEVLPAA